MTCSCAKPMPMPNGLQCAKCGHGLRDELVAQAEALGVMGYRVPKERLNLALIDACKKLQAEMLAKVTADDVPTGCIRVVAR